MSATDRDRTSQKATTPTASSQTAAPRGRRREPTKTTFVTQDPPKRLLEGNMTPIKSKEIAIEHLKITALWPEIGTNDVTAEFNAFERALLLYATYVQDHSNDFITSECAWALYFGCAFVKRKLANTQQSLLNNIANELATAIKPTIETAVKAAIPIPTTAPQPSENNTAILDKMEELSTKMAEKPQLDQHVLQDETADSRTP